MWRATYQQDLSDTFIDKSQTVYKNTDGRFLFKDLALNQSGDTSGAWWINNSLGVEVRIDGSGVTPNWYLYDGNLWWAVPDGYLWFSSSENTWVISSRLGSCIAEEWDDSADDSANHKYIGDAWWSNEYSSGIEGRYEARGSLRGSTQGDYEGTAKEVTLYIDGYRHNGSKGAAPAGEYNKVTRDASVDSGGDVTVDENENSSDNGRVGVPRFTDGKSNEYIKSVEKDSTGYYTYGTVYYNEDFQDSNWGKGTPGSGTWWELSSGEPEAEGSDQTFRKYGLDENGDREQLDRTSFSWDEYVIGNNKESLYVGETGLWV